MIHFLGILLKGGPLNWGNGFVAGLLPDSVCLIAMFLVQYKMFWPSTIEMFFLSLAPVYLEMPYSMIHMTVYVTNIHYSVDGSTL